MRITAADLMFATWQTPVILPGAKGWTRKDSEMLREVAAAAAGGLTIHQRGRRSRAGRASPLEIGCMSRKKALKLAIKALEFMKRRYAVGHFTYLNGGNWKFAEKDHKRYVEIDQAIEELSHG